MFSKVFITLIVLLFIVNSALAQGAKKDPATIVSDTLRSSATFAEVVLRRVELESNLEEMLVSYTEEYPKMKETRYELTALRKEIAKLNSIKPNETGKLTEALGKLIVRKASVETDYWVLSKRFNQEHPEVKRAKRKLEIFEKALQDIL